MRLSELFEKKEVEETGGDLVENGPAAWEKQLEG